MKMREMELRKEPSKVNKMASRVFSLGLGSSELADEFKSC